MSRRTLDSEFRALYTLHRFSPLYRTCEIYPRRRRRSPRVLHRHAQGALVDTGNCPGVFLALAGLAASIRYAATAADHLCDRDVMRHRKNRPS